MNADGNERLTAAVGVLLLAPVLVEIATVLLGVHTFMSWHVFVGLALIPVVVIKLATTGWRFARYYTRSRDYVEHGPPQLAMRLLAPLFVAATLVLFGSGVTMGFLHGHALQIARNLHGPASVVWLLLLGIHVLVYLGRALRRTADDVLPADRAPVRGKSARLYGLAAAVVCGLLLGGALVPAQHRWVDIRHGHHDRSEGQSASRNAARRRTQAARKSFVAPGSFRNTGPGEDPLASRVQVYGMAWHPGLAWRIDGGVDKSGDAERLAKNEVLFRSVNEAIEQQALRFGGIDDEYEFICECSSSGCVERVTLTLRQYEQVRAEGTRFVLAPGHADPQVELVVQGTANHQVVEKDGPAGIIAEQEDPRSAEAPSDFEAEA